MRRRNDHGEAGGGEHAGLGVDGLAVILGADKGMIAAMFGEDTLDMPVVGGDKLANIVGGEIEEALNAIALLGLQGDAALTFQEGAGGEGGAPEDAGGIGAGGHGVKVPVELENGDGLGLIDGEKKVGGGTEDIGTGLAGKELELGIAQLVEVAIGGFPKAARTDTGIEGEPDTTHVDLGLGLEGGGDGNDATAAAGIAEEQPGEEVGLELVLAGLAREDDDEGEAAIMDNGILDGIRDLDLIGTQMYLAGMGPERRG